MTEAEHKRFRGHVKLLLGKYGLANKRSAVSKHRCATPKECPCHSIFDGKPKPETARR